MQNTSLGFHTFQFSQEIDSMEFSKLTGDFINYANQNNEMKRFPVKNKNDIVIGWKYWYEHNKGIQWLLMSRDFGAGFSKHRVLITINPKAIIKGDYIRAACENDLDLVEKIFNQETDKISPILSKFGFSSLNRVDYCLNVDLKELGIPCSPRQMMTLIKRGNVPKHFEELKIYDKSLHRKTTDKNSFYLKSKSVVINFYWKYPQQTEQHPNYIYREESKNVIRLEVQCKYPKMYSIAKEKRDTSKFNEYNDDISFDELYMLCVEGVHNPSIPADVVLSKKMSEEIINKYFAKILRTGDYFTLDGARKIVESHNFRRDKEERMLFALEQVNKFRGIAEAKAKMSGLDLDDFKRSLKDLDEILVNPVTIPRGWGIKHVPNLLRVYYDSIYEETFVLSDEFLALKKIEKFLYDK